MRPLEQKAEILVTPHVVKAAPSTFGFADCMAVLVGFALLAVAVLWPERES